jgi:hypothetical protein
MKMLKVHQHAPTSMLKSQNCFGVIPLDPVSKGEGRGGEGRGGGGGRGRGRGRGEGEGEGGGGGEGIGVWPTQKLSHGALYVYT